MVSCTQCNTLDILPDPNPENCRVDYYYYYYFEKSRVDYLGSTKSVENSGVFQQKHSRPLRDVLDQAFVFPQSTQLGTTALTQKGLKDTTSYYCVSCFNNDEGGNSTYSCGPHGFLSIQRAIVGLSDTIYFVKN